MSTVNEPLRFGDVVKLQTKSAFVDSAAPLCLGFIELPGKTQTQLLVVPPVKDEVKDRFLEAEFIIAPIRGEKQQANGTPLTCQTPFVLRTSDGKDGSTYSLNNKVAGQREGVSLQVSTTKGEMYVQVEKEGSTTATSLHYGDDGLSLRVVDSNRVRKTLNQLLTHVVKPKSDTPGGIVACAAKGSSLTFSFERAVDADGKPLTETRKYIKNPQARRNSTEALSPSKMNQLSRADRVDSSEFSDVDALSRSSSIAGFSSNPASPRNATASTPVDAAAVAARLPAVKDNEAPEVEASVPTDNSTNSSNESSKSAQTKKSPASPPKPATVDEKAVSPAASPAKLTSTKSAKGETVKMEPVKVEAVNVEVKSGPVRSEPAKMEPVKADTAKSAQPKASTTTPPLAPIITAAAPGEPKTVLADVSTFPPSPTINGPAPAPVVASPKAAAASTISAQATATPASPPKLMKEEDVAKLKAEADVENLEPACGAKCSLM